MSKVILSHVCHRTQPAESHGPQCEQERNQEAGPQRHRAARDPRGAAPTCQDRPHHSTEERGVEQCRQAGSHQRAPVAHDRRCVRVHKRESVGAWQEQWHVHQTTTLSAILRGSQGECVGGWVGGWSVCDSSLININVFIH